MNNIEINLSSYNNVEKISHFKNKSELNKYRNEKIRETIRHIKFIKNNNYLMSFILITFFVLDDFLAASIILACFKRSSSKLKEALIVCSKVFEKLSIIKLK